VSGVDRISDDEYAERLAGLDRPVLEGVTLEADGRGALKAVHVTEPAVEKTPDPEGEPPEAWQPAEGLEQLVARHEAILAPAVAEAERQAQLAQLADLTEQAQGLSPAEQLALARQWGEQRAAERLGMSGHEVARQQAAELATEIAVEQVGGQERWQELAPAVLEHMQARPEVYNAVVERGDPAEIGRTLVGVAQMVQQGEEIRQAAERHADMKRAAITQSGGTARPANMTDDERYAARIYEAAKDGGYGS